MVTSKYFAPKTIEEASYLLDKYGNRAKIIAGGTDLLRQIKSNTILPRFIISMGGIPALNSISHDKVSGTRIGALATVDSISKSPPMRSYLNVLSQAAGMLGTPTIRAQATIGGNLCNASPSADVATALLVLDAKIKIVGTEGERIVSIDDFFTGPGETILRQNQIVTEIQIPNLPPQCGTAYEKQTRRQGADLAIVGVAVLVVMQGDVSTDVKIGMGAVAPIPIRAKHAEEILKGKKLEDKLLEEASKAASDESKPIDDIRGNADYRKKVVAALVKRAVRQAAEYARTEE